MALLPAADWRSVEAIAGIGYVNPFLPERIELERRALGPRFREEGPVIRARPGERMEDLLGNVPALRERAETLAAALRGRIIEHGAPPARELVVYEDLCLYLLYARHMNSLDGLVSRSFREPGWKGNVAPRLWESFESEFAHFLRPGGVTLPTRHDPAIIFAGFFQIERAFTHIYHRIIGGSMPAARLRAAAWQSIFTCDMKRYLRSLHRTMADISTLIVGPSGSGKELVARAIGLSGFITFDPETFRFAAGSDGLFVPLNLAALAPMLIESELFGHVQGAFSGAVKDRQGFLEKCVACGAVFLDEIGELDSSTQVKLLRVLESRGFQKVGSTDTSMFKGKIIAATNRDLAAEMQAGRFRHDLYYRLCADQIATPSLAEQLADRPEDLPELVSFIAQDVLNKGGGNPDGPGIGPDLAGELAEESGRLTEEVVDWIDRELGRDYAWPGNFRELGQCVRNVMIRRSYRPASPPRERVGGSWPVDELLHQVREAEISADQLLGRYYALVFHRSNDSYTAAGQRLGVDWRVVKRRLGRDFLERLQRAEGPSAVKSSHGPPLSG